MAVALSTGLYATHTLVPPTQYINGWVADGLKNAATIISITGAGGQPVQEP